MLMDSITLAQQNKLEALRMRYGRICSSHAFSSLYMWQTEMKLKLYLEPKFFAVQAGWRGAHSWFFPCGEPEAVAGFLRQLYQKDPAAVMCYARCEDIAFAERLFPEQFWASRMPQDDEYLYDRAEQSEMRGAPFRHQRSAMHKAVQSFGACARLLDDDTMSDAFQILDKWRKIGHSEGCSLQDVHAAEMLLQAYRPLSVRGVVVYVEGKPAVLAAGYPLDARTFDVSLCRQSFGDRSLSVFARQKLYEILPSEFACLNAEEDLGIPSLRILKNNMRPSGRIEMYEGGFHGNEAYYM